MHSKNTVKYICEEYLSGNQYYYKQEIITHDSWNNLCSLSWSASRPISRRTFERRRKEGYKTENYLIEKAPADVIPFENSASLLKNI